MRGLFVFSRAIHRHLRLFASAPSGNTAVAADFGIWRGTGRPGRTCLGVMPNLQNPNRLRGIGVHVDGERLPPVQLAAKPRLAFSVKSYGTCIAPRNCMLDVGIAGWT